MPAQRIGIIGAGVGGLATAARLASRGYQVDVFEKLDACGGRNSLLEDSGFRFDMGPSFVMMPDFFEELFRYCGRQMRDYLDLKVLDINYKIFYPDNQCLTVYCDQDKTREELERLEKGSGQAYDRLIADTGKIYGLVRPLLYRCFSPLDAANPRYLGLTFGIRAFESYWNMVRRYFKSEKLCYAFTFEAMFIGVSPFNAPAFYSVINYTDHVQKIAHPMGGMYRIPQALERLGKERGARYYYGTEITGVSREGGKFAFRHSSGSESGFDRAVVNADYPYSLCGLLKRKLPKYDYSCSVYLLYLGLKRKVSGFAHHNLFFARDLERNLKEIFSGGRIPEDPSFYVHVPTVTDPSLAPADKEILYVLVPVPNLERLPGGVKGNEERLRGYVLDRIDRVMGIKVRDLIEVEHRFYPEDFTRRYNILYGATFGLAHTLRQSAFFRPQNRDRKIKGLYYVGASVQPGGGLPPVIAGSRIVADLIAG